MDSPSIIINQVTNLFSCPVYTDPFQIFITACPFYRLQEPCRYSSPGGKFRHPDHTALGGYMLMGRVGLGLSIVASMTLGIVVDDTVHFLSKYLRARREYEMSPAEAVRYSYKTVGTAMLITTVALVAGFSVLAFSGFKMNGDMGMMAALTISLALVLDFFYLPILLMKFDGKSVKQTNNITSNLMEKSHETFNTDFNISTDAVPVTADSRNMGRNASRERA